jgi:hypothetical protein
LIRGDKDIVTIAVEKNGLSIRYASDNLKCDAELCLKAVK